MAIVDISSLKILIVEPLSSARNLIAETVKGAGYKEFVSMDSLKSAIGFLEVEELHWLICPLQTGEGANALQLLHIMNSYPPLHQTVISLLVDDEEMIHLPKAFELGLMSWHKKSYTKDHMKAEFKALIELLKENNGNALHVANAYAQKAFRTRGYVKSWLSLQEGMFAQNPDSGPALLGLAEAQFQNNLAEDGKYTLARAHTLKVVGWEKIAAQFIAPGESLNPKLALNSCLVVDPDETVHKTIQDLLTAAGVVKINCFLDGESALQWMSENPPPELLIQEWRIPKVTGPNLIQRVRQMGFQRVPIVIVSSLTNKQDLQLLNEMSAATVIEKPINKEEFAKQVGIVMQQERTPVEPRSLERKICENLYLGNKDKADELRLRLEAILGAPDGLKKYVRALFKFYEHKYDLAQKFAIESLKAQPDQVRVVHLLGKILLKKRDFPGAAKCLQRAQEISPKNIERLCELATAQSEMGDFKAAQGTLDAAKNIDPGNPAIVVEESKVALKSGDVSLAKELFLHISTPLNAVIADMNNSAVALIHTASFESGVELYERTLTALPQSEVELYMRVSYNLALAHARQEHLEKADEVLSRISNENNFSIAKKINQLKLKIKNAMQNKTPLGMAVAPEASVSADPWQQELDLVALADQGINAAAGDLTAGQKCCYLVFRCNREEGLPSMTLLGNAPAFKPRPAYAGAGPSVFDPNRQSF